MNLQTSTLISGRSVLIDIKRYERRRVDTSYRRVPVPKRRHRWLDCYLTVLWLDLMKVMKLAMKNQVWPCDSILIVIASSTTRPVLSPYASL